MAFAPELHAELIDMLMPCAPRYGPRFIETVEVIDWMMAVEPKKRVSPHRSMTSIIFGIGFALESLPMMMPTSGRASCRRSRRPLCIARLAANAP